MGSVSVRALNTAAGCQASEPESFFVSYGLPSPTGISYDDRNLCSTGIVYFTAKIDDPNATVQWYISGRGGRLRFGSTGQRVAVYIADPQGEFDLSLEVRNICNPAPTPVDPIQAGTFYCENFDYSCGVGYARGAYPNPADATLTVPGSGGATLYNAFGVAVAQLAPGQRQLGTARLPEGLYYLQLPGRAQRQRISIRH